MISRFVLEVASDSLRTILTVDPLISEAAEREAAKEKKGDDQNDSGVESPNPAKEGNNSKPELSDASTATDKARAQSDSKEPVEVKPVAKG